MIRRPHSAFPFFALVLVLLLAACGGKKDNEFLIEGTIANYPNQRLLLEHVEGDNRRFIDSAITDAEGKFRFKGPELGDALVEIRTLANKVLLMFPGNSHLVVDAVHDSLNTGIVSGDVINEQFTGFRQRQSVLLAEYKRNYQTMRNFKREINLEAWRKHEAITDQTQIAYRSFLRTFIDTVQSPLLRGVAALSYNSTEDFYRMEKMTQVMKQQLPNHHMTRILEERMLKDRKRFWAIETPDFMSYSASGDSVSLAQTRGKVVLFYAWASYCEMSRRENKKLREYFKEHPNSEFVLVDYSFDDDKEAWLKALAEDSLPSQHHLLSPGGWANHAVRDLGIRSIPFTYIFDAKGIIRTANIFTEDLEEDADSIIGRYRLRKRSQ